MNYVMAVICLVLLVVIVVAAIYGYKRHPAKPIDTQNLKADIGNLIDGYAKLHPSEQQKINDVAGRVLETLNPTANYILTGKKTPEPPIPPAPPPNEDVEIGDI